MVVATQGRMRQLISAWSFTADLTLVVDDVPATSAALTALATKYGGYVTTANISEEMRNIGNSQLKSVKTGYVHTGRCQTTSTLADGNQGIRG